MRGEGCGWSNWVSSRSGTFAGIALSSCFRVMEDLEECRECAGVCRVDEDDAATSLLGLLGLEVE